MKVDRAGLRQVARVTLTHEEEDSSYEHVFDHGRSPDDRRNIEWIRGQLMQGNTWAWASVCVKATLHDLTGEAYIGQCSYESEAAFKADGGYYEQLVEEAVKELAVAIERLTNEHDVWEHDRVLCIECAAKPLSETT